MHALNKTSLKTNKRTSFGVSGSLPAAEKAADLVWSTVLKPSPSEATQQSVLPPGDRPGPSPGSAGFLTFTFVSGRRSLAWRMGYSFPGNLPCHPYQTELQPLLGWCTYRIEPWWQILRRRPEATPQTERTRPTSKSLSWSRKKTKTVEVTGMHVYTAGSFSFDI